MHGDSTLLFIVCAGVATLLNAVALPKAIASRNVGMSMLIIWTELACLFQFANAIRWNGNFKDWAPLWCDFFGRFIIAADVALTGAGVSINRRLYMILTLDPRRRQTSFNAIVDIIFCLVIPLVSVALQYVVQQYRYYIVEDVGCIPGIGSVDLAFPLVWMLPLLVGSVSAGYACHTIRVSLRQSYKARGDPRHSIGWSRRLITIEVVTILYTLIPTSMTIALAATAYPVTSWPGWKAVHSTIDDVVYVPAREWHINSIYITSIELRRWTVVSLSFVIFIFFGLTSDMRKVYWAPFRGISQAGAKPERNTHEDSNTHWQGQHSFLTPSEETPTGRQQTSLGSNVESIELALPLVVTYSISPQESHP